FRLSQKNILVFLLSASFMVCATLWSQPENIVDASRYFLQAKSLASNGPAYFIDEWGYGIAAWTDLPLVPFIYGMIFKFVGEYRLAIQAVTTLFFCGTVLLTFLIGTELWDEETGLYAGALLLGMPFLLTQVPLMLVDIPTMFFLSLAVYTTLKAVKTGTVSWLGTAIISIVLALLCKYSTWLMLTVLPVIAISCRGGCWAKLGKQITFVLTGVLIFLIILLTGKSDLIVSQIDLLISYQLPGLDRWQESHISTFLYQVHPFITLAALYSIYLAWRKRDVRYMVVIWMLLLVLLLEIKRIRYALIAFPMLALMAAYALRQISDSRIRNYLVLCIIVSSLTVTLYGYSSFMSITSANNIKQAGVFLNNIKSPAVEVIVLPQTKSSINPAVSIPLLDLFTNKNLVYRNQLLLIPESGHQYLKKSSLRFSWEYNLANYYEMDNETGPGAIVVISTANTQSLPAEIIERLNGYYLKRRFAQNEGVYRYSTIVDIYEPVGQQESVDTKV
ncbi:MAG: ArnT family glycosyltransferase, partial [Planctomycetota bacterium]